jgi:hypothetical protein
MHYYTAALHDGCIPYQVIVCAQSHTNAVCALEAVGDKIYHQPALMETPPAGFERWTERTMGDSYVYFRS